jgi:hypothetical protein
MSWLNGEFHDGWTSSSYAGHGILFQNLPTEGDQGGSPLLDDGGVNGDEIRWGPATVTSGSITVTLFEDGSFESSGGAGGFSYTWWRNGVAQDDQAVIISSADAIDATVIFTMPQFNVSVAATTEDPSSTITGNVNFNALTSGSVSDSGNALGALDGTYTTNTNNASWTARFSFAAISEGFELVGTQTATLRVRRQSSGGGDPTVNSITLYNGAIAIGNILPSAVVALWPSNDIIVTFDGTGIADPQLQIATSGAGGGTSRRTVQIDGAILDYEAQEVASPSVDATVSYTMPQFAVAVSGDATEPAFDATIAATMPQFSVDVSASVGVAGVNATLSYAMPQFTAAVTAESLAPTFSAAAAFAMPQFTASVAATIQAPVVSGSVAYTMPQFTVAATGEQTAPEAGAAVSFTMPQFATAATASVTAPAFSASVSYAMPQFAVAATAESVLPGGGATVSFVMPQFQAAAQGSAIAPEFTATVSATMPQFSVTASAGSFIAGNVATVALTMPQFAASISAINYAPVYSATVTTTMPQFSVSILSGEFDYYESEGATVFYLPESTTVQYLAESAKIIYTNESTQIEWRA